MGSNPIGSSRFLSGLVWGSSPGEGSIPFLVVVSEQVRFLCRFDLGQTRGTDNVIQKGSGATRACAQILWMTDWKDSLIVAQ